MKKVFLFILSVFLTERENSSEECVEISREDESVSFGTLSNGSNSHSLSGEEEGFHPHVGEKTSSVLAKEDDNSSNDESETLGLEDFYASPSTEETLKVSDKEEESISGKEEECIAREGKVYYSADGTRVTDDLSEKITITPSSQPLTPAKLDKSRVEMFLQSQWESKPPRRPSFSRIFKPIMINNSNTINQTSEVDPSCVKELESSQDHNGSAIHTKSNATDGVVEESQSVKDSIRAFSALCNESANLSINPRVVDAVPKEDSAKSRSPENSSSDTEECAENSESETTSDETSSAEEPQKHDCYCNSANCPNMCRHNILCSFSRFFTDRRFRKSFLKQDGEGFILKVTKDQIQIKGLEGEINSTDLENRDDMGENQTTTLIDKSGSSSSFSVENTPAQGEICDEYQQDNQQGEEKESSDSEEQTNGEIELGVDKLAIEDQGLDTTTSGQLESRSSSSTVGSDSLSTDNVDSLQNSRRLVGKKKSYGFFKSINGGGIFKRKKRLAFKTQIN